MSFSCDCVPFFFLSYIFTPAKHSGPYLLSLADWFNLWYRPIFACRKIDAPITHRGILTFGLVGCGGPHTMVDILALESTLCIEAHSSNEYRPASTHLEVASLLNCSLGYSIGSVACTRLNESCSRRLCLRRDLTMLEPALILTQLFAD